ncbi:MAG: hypothetical protein ACRDWI_00540 [Jiangellaceae bacterium]
MADPTDALVQSLIEAVPSLRERLASLRGEDLGPDLAWVFLDEATRDLRERSRHGDVGARADIASIAAALEPAFGADFETDLLIDDAFMVQLPWPGDPDADLLDQLGPNLWAAVDRQRDWRLPPAVASFIDRLVDAVPALRPLADDHKDGYHDAVLSHPFLADVVRREVNLFTGGRSFPVADDMSDEDVACHRVLFTSDEADPATEVRTVFGVVERECGHDDAVDELIAVSFVESLPTPDEPGGDVIDLLGPALRAMLDR